MKLEVGMKLENIIYDTPYAKGVSLKEGLKGKTMLLFLRYYGCTLCQYDMLMLKEAYDKVEAVGGCVKVVLQSDPAALAEELGEEGYYPFEIICDPECALYKAYEIDPAGSMAELAGGNIMEKITAAKALGLSHGRYEGIEEQLPAAFVIDNEMTITYAHYGKNGTDIPSPEEIVELLK